ncbi:MAG TPA: glutamate racemase [Candidatus Latescibacteria bacterium]|nr:glutamate racemase [Candidatus Latescibacterota bacterium]HOM56227.1 glutamate racemase [Candidatus Latescibacterota bacterium]HOS64759.1 glutamate racemase [Candidatus Latescibacterota bacterium]HPK73573.1 glutamate racemase [Candidatus Latescibacterota bacterium]
MDRRPIGVFDSGVGGLTVVNEIQRQLPKERVVYFGDTARFPYGSKSVETVTEFARQDSQFLLEFDVKLIVVACNTATACALDHLREHLSVPVVGVIEPGAVAAVRASRRKFVGVIGTQGTIASGAYQRALTRIDPSISVFAQACPLFVSLAEEGWTDRAASLLIAHEYLDPLREAMIDVLVLGCTHYPLLMPVIRRVMGPETILTDSAAEVTREVGHLLQENELESDGSAVSGHRFFVSDAPLKFREVGERFLGRALPTVELATAG